MKEGLYFVTVMLTVCQMVFGVEEISRNKRSAEVSHDLNVPFASVMAKRLAGGQEVLQRVKRTDELEQDLRLDNDLARMKRVKKSMESLLETELRSLKRKKRNALEGDDEDDNATLSRVKRVRRSVRKHNPLNPIMRKRSTSKALLKAKRLQAEVRRLKRQAKANEFELKQRLVPMKKRKSISRHSRKQKALENLRNKIHEARQAMRRFQKNFGRNWHDTHGWQNQANAERAKDHRHDRLSLQRHLNLPRPNHPNVHAGKTGHVPHDKRSGVTEMKVRRTIGKNNSYNKAKEENL